MYQVAVMFCDDRSTTTYFVSADSRDEIVEKLRRLGVKALHTDLSAAWGLSPTLIENMMPCHFYAEGGRHSLTNIVQPVPESGISHEEVLRRVREECPARRPPDTGKDSNKGD